MSPEHRQLYNDYKASGGSLSESNWMIALGQTERLINDICSEMRDLSILEAIEQEKLDELKLESNMTVTKVDEATVNKEQ